MTAPVAGLPTMTDAGAMLPTAAQTISTAQNASSAFDALVAAFFAGEAQATGVTPAAMTDGTATAPAADPAAPNSPPPAQLAAAPPNAPVPPQSAAAAQMPLVGGPAKALANIPVPARQVLAHAADEARSLALLTGPAPANSPGQTLGTAPEPSGEDAASAATQTAAQSDPPVAVQPGRSVPDLSQPSVATQAEDGQPDDVTTAPTRIPDRAGSVEPHGRDDKRRVLASVPADSAMPATLCVQILVPQSAGAPEQIVSQSNGEAAADDLSPDTMPAYAPKVQPQIARPDNAQPQSPSQSAPDAKPAPDPASTAPVPPDSGDAARTANDVHPMALASQGFAGLLASMTPASRPPSSAAATPAAAKAATSASQPATDKAAGNATAIQPKFAAPSLAPPIVHTKPDAPVAPQAAANRTDPAPAPSPNPPPSTHASPAGPPAMAANDAGAPTFALPQSSAPATPAFIHAATIDASQPAPNAPPATDVAVRLAAATPGDQSADFAQLALHVAAKSAGGDSHFLVRLDPPELGRVEVTLNVDSQGNARATLSADQPKTLDLLQRDAPQLERALKDAGLDLAGGLSFSLKNGGGSGQRSADNSSRPRPLRIDAAGDAKALAVPATLFQRNWGASHARLDITV